MKEGTVRLDIWLWRARFGKTRAITQRLCLKRRLRVNGQVVGKAHYGLRPGDVLTLPLHNRIVIVRVLDLGHRRGPAAEARALYEDLTPVEDPNTADAAGNDSRRRRNPRHVGVERRSVL